MDDWFEQPAPNKGKEKETVSHHVPLSSLVSRRHIITSAQKRALDEIYPRLFLPLNRSSCEELVDKKFNVDYNWVDDGRTISDEAWAGIKLTLDPEISKVLFIFFTDKFAFSLVKHCFKAVDTRTKAFKDVVDYALSEFDRKKDELLFDKLYVSFSHTPSP